MQRLVNFTKGEAAALLHRLSSDAVADALAENPRDALAIDARCAEFIETLGTSCPFVVLRHDPHGRAQDLDILTDCVEGSTWVAVHTSPTAARQALKRAALKICAAFDKSPYFIEVPRS